MTDRMFKELTRDNPTGLLDLIEGGTLEPGFLSTAAEFAGEVNMPERVIPLLKSLTIHSYPMVREGAIYGLANFLEIEGVREWVEKFVRLDPSPGVRSAAQEMLES